MPRGETNKVKWEVHKYIKKNAQDILKFYLDSQQKTYTSRHFGISLGGLDRALLIAGHPELCAKSFASKWNKTDKKMQVKQIETPANEIPSFDKMANFLIDVIGKAETVPSLNTRIAELEMKLCQKETELSDLLKKYESLRDIKNKWEALTKGAVVTGGD